MSKDRLEAFSDGVIAILITIMVLELRTPHGTTWAALREDLPVLLAYVLSFVYIGIYWNNHHDRVRAFRLTSIHPHALAGGGYDPPTLLAALAP